MFFNIVINSMKILFLVVFEDTIADRPTGHSRGIFVDFRDIFAYVL